MSNFDGVCFRTARCTPAFSGYARWQVILLLVSNDGSGDLWRYIFSQLELEETERYSSLNSLVVVKSLEFN